MVTLTVGVSRTHVARRDEPDYKAGLETSQA